MLHAINTTYIDALQTPLFAAFLTLAGILFAVHNALVVNLYRDIYAKKEYRDFARKIEPGRNPFERLVGFSQRVRLTIAMCFATAIVHCTIGFVGHWSTTLLALGVTLVTVIHLVRMFRLQSQVISAWLEFLKVESEKNEAESTASQERFSRAISSRPQIWSEPSRESVASSR
jgi:hypothetical protein